MNRIRRRPLPSRRITIHHAVIWSSSALLACQVFAVKYVLAASNPVLCYAFVYTSLKHIYLVNTWIGAVVGAIPPLPGSAATSGEISLILMILPDGLYFWQILHFMALAFTVLMEGSRCFDLLILLCLSASATWPMIWV